MRRCVPLLVVLIFLCGVCHAASTPEFSGSPSSDLKTPMAHIRTGICFAPLDDLGRAGVATAMLSPDTLCDSPRQTLSAFSPSGYQSTAYAFIDGGVLYNKSHLIGWQLCGIDADENLITGTRFMNVAGMLPIENMIADYIRETGRTVAYRVTPDFRDDELVCRGVTIEAEAMGDRSFTISAYCYNVQPGIIIDYSTGFSRISDTSGEVAASSPDAAVSEYVLNTNTKKFHSPDCASVPDIKPKNRQDYTGSRDTLLSQGYAPCKRCNP